MQGAPPPPPLKETYQSSWIYENFHFEFQDNDTLKTSNVKQNEDEINSSRVDLTLALGRVMKDLKS
jgi:hypothetical protein